MAVAREFQLLRESSSFDRNREIPHPTRSGKTSFKCSSDGDFHHDSTLRRDEKTKFRGNCRLLYTHALAETWCLSVDEICRFHSEELKRNKRKTICCFWAYADSVSQICRSSIVISSTDHLLHIRSEQDGLVKSVVLQSEASDFNSRVQIEQCMSPSCQLKADMPPQFHLRPSCSTASC